MKNLIFILSVVLSVVCSASELDKVLSSTMRIRYERQEGDALITGHGTAFGVDLSQYKLIGKRYLLSAAHTILDDKQQPYKNVKVEVAGEWINCKVLSFDKELDLCLFKTEHELDSILKLDDDDLVPNDELIMAGSRRDAPVALFRGVLKKRFFNGRAVFYAEIAFDYGDSGAPIINIKTSKVVGVAIAGLPKSPKSSEMEEDRGLYVPLVALRDFLERVGK
jgi:hypothetical protein